MFDTSKLSFSASGKNQNGDATRGMEGKIPSIRCIESSIFRFFDISNVFGTRYSVWLLVKPGLQIYPTNIAVTFVYVSQHELQRRFTHKHPP